MKNYVDMFWVTTLIDISLFISFCFKDQSTEWEYFIFLFFFWEGVGGGYAYIFNIICIPDVFL